MQNNIPRYSVGDILKNIDTLYLVLKIRERRHHSKYEYLFLSLKDGSQVKYTASYADRFFVYQA
jgi:hypothetical protein